jgi:hypothetical protein
VAQSLKSSTSVEGEYRLVNIRTLDFDTIGRPVRLMGRDITLGLHGGPAIEQKGILETIRMRADRVVVVMLMPLREGRPPEHRTIQVMA